MPNIKVKSFVVYVSALFVLCIAVLLAYYFLQKDLADSHIPLESYMKYSIMSFNSASYADDVNDELKDIRTLQLRVISTGETSRISITNSKGEKLADVTQLKVRLDDGNSDVNEENSFNIAVELFPVGSEVNIAPNIISNINPNEGQVEEPFEIFSKGEILYIKPFSKKEFELYKKNMEIIKSVQIEEKGEKVTQFYEDLHEYRRIVNQYNKDQDYTDFIEEGKFKVENVKEPLFLMY